MTDTMLDITMHLQINCIAVNVTLCVLLNIMTRGTLKNKWNVISFVQFEYIQIVLNLNHNLKERYVQNVAQILKIEISHN